jgi:hypothetical protein
MSSGCLKSSCTIKTVSHGRLAGWTDSTTFYPKLIPPVRKIAGRSRDSLRLIELEEKEKIHRKRDFLMPDVRSGDIVEISYQ